MVTPSPPKATSEGAQLKLADNQIRALRRLDLQCDCVGSVTAKRQQPSALDKPHVLRIAREDRDEDTVLLLTGAAANYVRQRRSPIRIAVISLSPTVAQDNDLARLSRRQSPELVLARQFPTETPGRLAGRRLEGSPRETRRQKLHRIGAVRVTALPLRTCCRARGTRSPFSCRRRLERYRRGKSPSDRDPSARMSAGRRIRIRTRRTTPP